MSSIIDVTGRQVFDSRGNPTVEQWKLGERADDAQATWEHISRSPSHSIEKARVNGERGLKRLQEIQRAYPNYITEVRGSGMLFAMAQPLLRDQYFNGLSNPEMMWTLDARALQLPQTLGAAEDILYPAR